MIETTFKDVFTSPLKHEATTEILIRSFGSECEVDQKFKFLGRIKAGFPRAVSTPRRNSGEDYLLNWVELNINLAPTFNDGTEVTVEVRVRGEYEDFIAEGRQVFDDIMSNFLQTMYGIANGDEVPGEESSSLEEDTSF